LTEGHLQMEICENLGLEMKKLQVLLSKIVEEEMFLQGFDNEADIEVCHFFVLDQINSFVYSVVSVEYTRDV
jgi:hypothetical protein